jgi:prepilin-type N-terminal cleavage/methylation domain-containing protein
MKRRNSGFSLVEMAIVLVIFGLVLASASSILGLFVNKGGAERTRKMMDSNKNSLISIAAGKGYYIKSGETYTSTSDVISAMSYPQDAYGRDFHLVIDDTLNYYETGAQSKSELDYKPVCGTDSTTMTIHLCKDASNGCDSTAEYTEVKNVGLVLVSGSSNKNVQTDVKEISGENVVKVWFQGTDAKDDYTSDVNRAEKYDDIVDWITLPELRTKAGCDPVKLDFLDTSVPVLSSGSYRAEIYPKGGIPFILSPSSSGKEIESYEWKVYDDLDGEAETMIDDHFIFQVVEDDPENPEDMDLDEFKKGQYMVISGNASVATKSYKIKIIIRDDSSRISGGIDNDVDRTIIFRKQ